jgi:glutamate synthase (NADPH/NADH) small chain
MPTASQPDVRAGRLPPAVYAQAFADASPRLTRTQALLEAERCLYCFDAPCATACPTSIDVPSFIKRIADDNLRGAARTILESNPLGGMCARVCPTETLCEAVCVRNSQEGKPVAIGRLQRYAVDALMESDTPQLYTRAPRTGKTVAVVGAGPAGLACVHNLARQGHDVALFDARPKAGGLNEYGLASYKTTNNFAQREVQWLLAIGGISMHHGWKLDTTVQLDDLRRDFDAVFLGMGLSATHALGVSGEHLMGVRNAVDFIAELRQCTDLSTLAVGRRVVVIGGGMTAVDAAVQAKLLGAETVHMVYRRGPEALSASQAEQEWAQTNDVRLHYWLAPQEMVGSLDMANPASRELGHVCAVRFSRQALVDGRLAPTGETEVLQADMVLMAIGQQLGNPLLLQAGFTMADGRIATDAEGQTNLDGVWAGGDCRAGGLDLTVVAVEHGKQSAHAIHAYLNRS